MSHIQDVYKISQSIFLKKFIDALGSARWQELIQKTIFSTSLSENNFQYKFKDIYVI